MNCAGSTGRIFLAGLLLALASCNTMLPKRVESSTPRIDSTTPTGHQTEFTSGLLGWVEIGGKSYMQITTGERDRYNINIADGFGKTHALIYGGPVPLPDAGIVHSVDPVSGQPGFAVDQEHLSLLVTMNRLRANPAETKTLLEKIGLP